MAQTATFRPKARLLQLLGDELIGSARLAVFELVKNAYDADATRVTVTLSKLNSESARITVVDNGSGMSADIIRSIWLTPANDHRRRQREAGTRSPLGRLPLGEKGLGRFAVHKLGNRIEMVTRQTGQREVVVRFDWADLNKYEFLDEVSVDIEERAATVFKSDAHGTQISITSLREDWTRGAVRDLHRSLTSIADPSDGPTDFHVLLRVPGNESYVEDLPDPQSVLNRALWRFQFDFDGKALSWRYEFRHYGGMKVEGNSQTGSEPLLRDRDQQKVVADKAMINGIGPISGSYHVFDRDRSTWNLLDQRQLVADYLKINGGVRIYRDGVRVYNYGEPDDDWLGLDLRRVNTPTERVSRNQILGRVNLRLEGSTQLIEKTNREGFVEGDALDRLKEVAGSAMAVFDRLRRPHREAIRKALTGVKSPAAVSIDAPVERLRSELRTNKLDRLVPLLDEINREYEQLREIMLNSGNAGLQLSLIFHELERGVKGLLEAIRRHEPIEQIEKRSRYLKDLLGGFATILRKEPVRRHSMAKLAREALFLNQLRFEKHSVQLDFPLGKSKQDDVEVRAPRGLIIGAISNAIDNAIYWTRVRWPDEVGSPCQRRRIWIGLSEEFGDHPALIVADNGPGLQDAPDDIVRPFWTRRPGGMGLGLYYANLAMELAGGKLAFPDYRELDLPEGIDGVAIAFVFRAA